MEDLNKISHVLNISTDYLLGLTDEQHLETDYEWRYAPAQNRFGTILSKYRKQNNLSHKDFATQLDISEELLFDLESGKHSPSMSLIQKIAKVTKYDIDYITGAKDSTQIPNGIIKINNVSFDCFENESDVYFKTRFEELCLKKNITLENTEKFLGLSQQTFNDIRYNRMPTLSELLKISYAFNVPIDYLIGRTDSLFISLTNDEQKLLNNYRQLGEHYRNKVNTEASEQLLQQERDAYMRLSVAADEPLPLRKTGTDSGK